MDLVCMNNSNKKSFDRLLAFHSAPALSGIKTANLLTFKKVRGCNLMALIDEFNLKATSKGIYIKILCECNSSALLLVYNEALLLRDLNKESSVILLESYGYNAHLSLEEKLDLLGRRISAIKDFPHEIGLFLGYPIDDVVGFIKHSGKNYIFSGYWKVYSNEEKTQRLFNRYTKCRTHLCNKISQGMTIYQALKIA